MNNNRELAAIYTIQANRAGRVAIAIVVGGGLATFLLAIRLASEPNHGIDEAMLFAVFGIGVALTSALYLWASGLQTRAQAAAVRHRTPALDEELAE